MKMCGFAKTASVGIRASRASAVASVNSKLITEVRFVNFTAREERCARSRFGALVQAGISEKPGQFGLDGQEHRFFASGVNNDGVGAFFVGNAGRRAPFPGANDEPRRS